MTTPGLLAAGRNGTVVPVASVLAAILVLVVAAAVIWWLVRRERRTSWAERLDARLAEIARIEADRSTEAAAGTFGSSARWARDRKRVMKLEADLDALAAAPVDDRAARTLRALRQWRTTLDASYEHDGAEIDRARVVAASAALRAELARRT